MSRAGDAEALAAARREARRSLDEGGSPVGAVVVLDGAIVGVGRNRLAQTGDPTSHAEMEAYRDAARRLHGDPGTIEARLAGATVVTTAMPCEMCAGAIVRFAAARVVVAEAATYVPAPTRAAMEAAGIAVEIVDDAATRRLVEGWLSGRPEARAAWHHGERHEA